MKRFGAALACTLLLACSESTAPPLDQLDLVAISAGQDHSCAFSRGGEAFCWGSNNAGQLASTATGHRTVSTPMRVVASPLALTTIQAGAGRSCTLLSNGAPFCAGDGIAALRPLAGGLRLAELRAGAFICGLVADGTVHCWSTTDAAPQAIAGAPALAQLSVGAFACGLTGEGAAYCWQSGGVAAAMQASHRFSTIAVGESFACGLVTPGGTPLCWTPDDRNTAAPLWDRDLPPLASLVVGGAHACGLSADGVAYCWGAARSGQLGFGGPAPDYGITWNTPLTVAGGYRWRALAAGALHTCGLTTEGIAYCWGANAERQLGDGTDTLRSEPVEVGGRR